MKKHGIELRTDNRFDSKSTYVDIFELGGDA